MPRRPDLNRQVKACREVDTARLWLAILCFPLFDDGKIMGKLNYEIGNEIISISL